MQGVRLAPLNGLFWSQSLQNSDILADRGFSSLLIFFFLFCNGTREELSLDSLKKNKFTKIALVLPRSEWVKGSGKNLSPWIGTVHTARLCCLISRDSSSSWKNLPSEAELTRMSFFYSGTVSPYRVYFIIFFFLFSRHICTSFHLMRNTKVWV